MIAQFVLLYHCLHCGKVIHEAQQETSAPKCCGVDMIKAAETNVVSESTSLGSNAAALHGALDVVERTPDMRSVPIKLER